MLKKGYFERAIYNLFFAGTFFLLNISGRYEVSQHLLWLTSVRDLKELEPAQFNWLKEEGLARGFPDPFIHHFLQMDDQEKLGKLVLAIKDPALTVFIQKKK